MIASWGTACSAIAAALVCCTSCIRIERQDFPQRWAPVAASAAACPDLTARYTNSDQGRPSVPLAKWMLPRSTYSLETIARVDLSGPTDGSVTVRLVDTSGAELAVRTLKEGTQYRCENGWLVVLLEGHVLPAATAYTSIGRLARGRDGNLIVDATETAGGIVGVVPGYANARSWHRYSVADD